MFELKRTLFLIFFGLLASALEAFELIEKIQIEGNQKTKAETILRLSGLEEGREFTRAQLSEARSMIESSGVFEEVKMSQAIGSDRDHKVITISVKEKTTWFLVPAFSYSQSGFSGGGVVGETNLWGHLKKAVLFGDFGPDLRRAALGYRDSSFFGSQMTLALDAIFRTDLMQEYSQRRETRKVRVREWGGTFLPGIRWTENVTTSLGLYFRYVRQGVARTDPLQSQTLAEDRGKDIAVVAQFDFKKSSYRDGLMEGTEIQFTSQFSDDRYFSDYDYHKQLIYLRQGFRFLNDRISLSSNGSVQLGKNLPYYIELMAGGDNLRGYLSRQFRGDTKYSLGEEALFPLYDFNRFILRTNVFWDSTMIYFKDVKDLNGNAAKRSNWHNGIGVGLRCYLKGINIPLFGFDFARGLEDGAFAYYLNVGAVF